MNPSLDRLWNRSAGPVPATNPGSWPPALARLLDPRGPAPSSVRLRMHGEIRVGRWRPFTAEEVIHAEDGFVWQASVRPFLRGADQLLEGAGRMAWTFLRCLPVVRGSGPDVTRSAVGRWLAESIWLPSMLLPERGAVWEGPRVTLARCSVATTIDLDLGSRHQLRGLRLSRWGNPGGGPFGFHEFGGFVDELRPFGAVTLPSRLRIGWFPGSERWAEGEFFRVTLDAAEFR